MLGALTLSHLLALHFVPDRKLARVGTGNRVHVLQLGYCLLPSRCDTFSPELVHCRVSD